MENNSQKNTSFLLKVSKNRGWLANRFSEFLNLLKMIYFKYPFTPIKVQTLRLLVYGFIYPFPRIILGERKAYKICQSFLKVNFPTVILPLSPLLKSKVIVDSLVGFGAYVEIYIYNIYFYETIKKGMNVVDVGSQMGMYTILAAEKVGESGRIITIEPEPENYKQLLKNIKLNDFRNVIPLNIALTDHEGFEKLYISSSPGSHSLIFHEDKNSYISIPTTTIDKLIEELNIKKIDIIKIDAEGAEIPILKGAEKTLKANPNIKLIIAAEHYPLQAKEVCSFLNKKGFKTKIFKNDIVTNI